MAPEFQVCAWKHSRPGAGSTLVTEHRLDTIVHFAGETYNIGGGNERSNIEIVTQICRLIDKFFAEDERLRERFPNCPAVHGKKNTTLIDFVTDRPGHDRRYAINTDRVRRELGMCRLRRWIRACSKQSPGILRTSHGGEV